MGKPIVRVRHFEILFGPPAPPHTPRYPVSTNKLVTYIHTRVGDVGPKVASQLLSNSSSVDLRVVGFLQEWDNPTCNFSKAHLEVVVWVPICFHNPLHFRSELKSTCLCSFVGRFVWQFCEVSLCEVSVRIFCTSYRQFALAGRVQFSEVPTNPGQWTETLQEFCMWSAKTT